jgi:hypothetical protein
MTETSVRGLRVDSWMSLNGRTWAVCDYHAILSMHRSQEEAESALAVVKQAAEEWEKKWAGPQEEAGPPY